MFTSGLRNFPTVKVLGHLIVKLNFTTFYPLVQFPQHNPACACSQVTVIRANPI